MYLVNTSNFDEPIEFKSLKAALAFVGDQVKMGFECSIKKKQLIDVQVDPWLPKGTITLKSGANSTTVTNLKTD